MDVDDGIEVCSYCGDDNKDCNCGMTQILHGDCIIGEGVIITRGGKHGNEK